MAKAANAKRIPQLRFPEFEGELNYKILKNAVKAHNSGIYKKKELYGDGQNIIGVSNIYGIECVDGQVFSRVPLALDEYAVHSLKAGDILYSESSLVRSGIAKSVYVTDRGAGTAFAWHTRRLTIDQSHFDSGCLYYFLETNFARKYITSVATQTVLTGITTRDYFLTPIVLPSLPEQKKIAAFLGEVDDRLAALRKKRDLLSDYKRGVMQQIFSQKIRFTRDDGTPYPDWEEKKLGDYLIEFRERVPSKTTLPVITSSRVGIRLQKDYFADRELANDGEYGVVPRGYFVYRHMSDDLTFKFNVNFEYKAAATSKEYPVFTTRNLSSMYLLFLLNESEQFKRFAAMQKRGGTRTRLYFSTLCQWSLSLPTLEEQQKIGNFLSAIDAKIDAVAEQINHTETFKKGLLQQMFV